MATRRFQICSRNDFISCINLAINLENKCISHIENVSLLSNGIIRDWNSLETKSPRLISVLCLLNGLNIKLIAINGSKKIQIKAFDDFSDIIRDYPHHNQLAKLSGISTSSISNWSNHKHSPSFNAALKVLRFMGYDMFFEVDMPNF